ncbi:hypothetical protein WJX72_007813 [[Myrmecia] bisecta]|uniref:Uncharacterized protein n=1 Tax=[Myrmecia] bisecta TaxID=41462 RepID=A0AAW1PYV2_9CHLO
MKRSSSGAKLRQPRSPAWILRASASEKEQAERPVEQVVMAPEGRKGRKVSSSDEEDARPTRQASAPLLARSESPHGAGWKIMGLDPSPELVAISMVYFVQGILGLARLAITFFYKDEFHLDPATVALLTSFGAAPWVVKPLYGFLSDTVPLFGYRRRSYLVGCGLLGTLSWLAMATVVNSPSAAVAAVIAGSLGTACSDVVVDSIVVERSRGHPQSTAGSLQSLCWASAAVGGIASAYFSGSLVEAYGPRGVFALTAIFPLIVSLSALLIKEERSSSNLLKTGSNLGDSLVMSIMAQTKALWHAVSQRSILLPAIFVFLWQSTPTADTAIFYFQTNQLHFSPEFLGRVRLVGSIASLAGVATYNVWLKEVPLRKMFLWTSVIGTGLGLTQLILITGANQQLGISNEYFVLGDSLVLTVLGQVAFMPVLVLAARLCPEGVEASLFAALMSLNNFGAFASGWLGAGLTRAFGVSSDNFEQLAPLVLQQLEHSGEEPTTPPQLRAVHYSGGRSGVGELLQYASLFGSKGGVIVLTSVHISYTAMHEGILAGRLPARYLSIDSHTGLADRLAASGMQGPYVTALKQEVIAIFQLADDGLESALGGGN